MRLLRAVWDSNLACLCLTALLVCGIPALIMIL